MKNYIITFVVAVLFSSCCKEVEPYTISGRIFNISDSSLYKAQTLEVWRNICRGSYGSSYQSRFMFTDSNGNFSIELDLIQPDSDYLIQKINDSTSGSFSSKVRGDLGDIYL